MNPLYLTIRTVPVPQVKYSDKWGNFRAVFAPQRSPGGRLYLAGAEYETAAIERELVLSTVRTIISTAVLLLAVFPLGWVFIRMSRQHTATLAAANRDLEAGRQHVAAILDSLDDAVIATNRAGRITRVNPVAVELLGIQSLPFAIGLYLPLSLSTPIMIGGLVAMLIKKSTIKKTVYNARQQMGILFASGVVAGDAIIGVITALLIVVSTNYRGFFDSHEGMNHSLTGTFGESLPARVSVSLDAASTWTLDADAYVSVFLNADTAQQNIVSNGHSIFYDSSAEQNAPLGGNTFALPGGGYLTPMI